MQGKNSVLVLGLAFAAFCVVAFSAYQLITLRESRFDPQKWRAHPYNGGFDPDNPRLKMVDDVVGNRLTPGMTFAQVTSLLGEPDEKTQNLSAYTCVSADASSCHTKAETSKTSIVFGYGLGAIADPVSLYVSFDKSSKMVKARQVWY